MFPTRGAIFGAFGAVAVKVPSFLFPPNPYKNEIRETVADHLLKPILSFISLS